MLGGALVGLLLGGCTSSATPPATTSPEPPNSSPSTVRTLTDANLIAASDLPEPSEGKIKAYDRNPRPADRASICQHPLSELGASKILSRSFKYSYAYSPKPTSGKPLANEPTTYTYALQFPGPQAAEQARQTYMSWLDTCRSGNPKRQGYQLVDRGFEWTSAAVSTGSTRVVEIAYHKAGVKTDFEYWESTGLTVVEDRMMVTIHLYYTDESLFGMHPEEDEEGYPHPQLGLVKAAAKRLAR